MQLRNAERGLLVKFDLCSRALQEELYNFVSVAYVSGRGLGQELACLGALHVVGLHCVTAAGRSLKPPDAGFRDARNSGNANFIFDEGIKRSQAIITDKNNEDSSVAPLGVSFVFDMHKL